MKSGALVIEGHIQGLSNVRALGERGIPVYVCDVSDCLARYSKYCLKFFKCPAFSSDDFVFFLTELATKENIAGWIILPSNDHIVYNISRNLNLICKYYKTVVPPLDRLENIVNKRNLLKVAEDAGIPVPVTFYELDDALKHHDQSPFLLKGIYGLSFYKAVHAKAFQINNNAELVRIWPTLPEKNVMIQELIPYDPSAGVISFTCFSVDGVIRTYWIGRKLREHPIKFGTATFSMSVDNQKVLTHSRSLISALNYTGVCEIEFMYDIRNDEYKLIEVNPRTWLWVGLARVCGVDYASIIYDYLNKSPIDYPTHYEVGLRWINGLTDSVFSLQSITRGYYSMKEYCKSLRMKKVRAVWSWNDLLPGIVFPFMSFYIAKRRR